MNEEQIEQKAKELVGKFEFHFLSANADYWTEPAKYCAEICCDEIIEVLGMSEVLADRVLASNYESIKEKIKLL